MAEEKVVVTEEVAEKAPEQKAPRGKKTNGKGPRKFNKNAPKREEKQYEERVVAINRVSKTVKGGRHMRFSALIVIGDGKGNFGFGTGKAGEVPEAIKKALAAAKNNMYHINIVKGGTVPHDVMGEYSASKVYLKPAKEGTGIIAGGPARNVCELAGIKNIRTKSLGSNNKQNVVLATIDALAQLKSPEEVAKLRGKSVEEVVG